MSRDILICSLSLKSIHQYYLGENFSHSYESPLERHPLAPEICLNVLQFWSKISRVVSDSDLCCIRNAPLNNIQINRARSEKGSGLELYKGIVNRI